MTTGEPMPYHETAIRGADGSSIRVAGGYSAVARSGSDGRSPAGRAQATAIVRDISAIRALEELREGFVATVSHELRTPLSLIRGYAETLLHLELDPAEQRDYLERIDEVTGRLSALVGQILDVTHLQADPLILERDAGPVRGARDPAARRPRDLGAGGSARRRPAGGPAADRSRRSSGRPDPREPRRERVQVRAAGRAPSASRRRSTGSGWRSRSTMRGSASRPRNGRSSRNRSIAPGTSANRGSREPASGCTSAGDWSRRTAAGSGWRTGRTAGPGPALSSRSRCCAAVAGPRAQPRRRARPLARAEVDGG